MYLCCHLTVFVRFFVLLPAVPFRVTRNPERFLADDEARRTAALRSVWAAPFRARRLSVFRLVAIR